MPPLILASGSPRRRELLERVGIAIEVMPPEIEESVRPGEPALTYARRVASDKAAVVAAAAPERWVLAADTVVVIEGSVLGKPSGPEEARDMLERLRGRPHEVITGIAAVDAATGRAESTVAVSRVVMASYPEAMIEAYVASGSPFDKAGGYAIQDLDGALVAGVLGSYTNVVGLPVEATRRLLERFGAVSERRA